MAKRLIDFIVSVIILTLLFPILLVLALIVLIFLGRPIFFIQSRPGLNEKLFPLIKFRSMSNKVGLQGQLLPDQERLSKFGSFMRHSSMDELPELLNVLRGDMSLVGPRPLFVQYLPLYSEEQRRRHEVRPGITGWAQVNGRNDVSWDEKFRLDVWYVDNRSFMLDVKILFLTVIRVIRGEGIAKDGFVTTDLFSGNDA